MAVTLKSVSQRVHRAPTRSTHKTNNAALNATIKKVERLGDTDVQRINNVAGGISKLHQLNHASAKSYALRFHRHLNRLEKKTSADDSTRLLSIRRAREMMQRIHGGLNEAKEQSGAGRRAHRVSQKIIASIRKGEPGAREKAKRFVGIMYAYEKRRNPQGDTKSALAAARKRLIKTWNPSYQER